MGTQKVLIDILDTARDRISPELVQQISASLHEWTIKGKESKNPWDRIVVAIMAEVFKMDIG